MNQLPKKNLKFWINGTLVEETCQNINIEESLIFYLRRLGYTGTKLGCNEGGCGSCTVLISTLMANGQLSHKPANACLTPVCSVDGKHVLTVEGLGNVDEPHPIQQAVCNSHGSQCGFCTPGIVMSIHALFQTSSSGPPSDAEIEDALDGNLCRCTGYRPILDAAKSVARSTEASVFGLVCLDTLKEQMTSDVVPYYFENDGVKWLHPVTARELQALVDEFPDAKLIHGNTEVGIETAFKNMHYPVLINVADVCELKSVEPRTGGVEFGALMTLSDFDNALQSLVADDQTNYRTRPLEAISKALKYFAGQQVRHSGSIAGNVCTASPISDLIPVLIAADSTFTVVSMCNSGGRQISARDFFVGYRKVALGRGEILAKIFVPFAESDLVFFQSFKQAKRRDDDIAIVNAGMRLSVASSGLQVSSCSLVYGGLAPTAKIAKETETALIGYSLKHEPNTCDLSVVPQHIRAALLRDFPLALSVPGGQAVYRKALSISFLAKFLDHVQTCLHNRPMQPLEIPRPVSSGQQSLENLAVSSSERGPVGESTVHMSGMKQVTGEAVYLDDMEPFQNEAHGVFLLSQVASGTLASVDIRKAQASRGFIAFICARDIPDCSIQYNLIESVDSLKKQRVSRGRYIEKNEHWSSANKNLIGPVLQDEEVYASKTVLYHGQPIGMVVANTRMNARKAMRAIVVSYSSVDSNPILTIEQAIAQNSFHAAERSLKTGCFKTGEAMQKSERLCIVKGQVRMAGQEHFYLEPQGSIALPMREDGEMEIFTSSQGAHETQHSVAHVLGVPNNRITVRIKRLGGGFGGKETRSIYVACAAAVAANRLGKPVRCILSREEDMATSGQRHPFLADYEVGIAPNGKIEYLVANCYSNAGYSVDLSIGVMERCLTHLDNVYWIPHVSLSGKLCKTNTPTNTAFRGFGGPQGMLIMENIMEHAAKALQIPAQKFREINFYAEGQLTPFGQPVLNVPIMQMWRELIETSNYVQRKTGIAHWNSSQSTRKRGISLIPTKFGISFGAKFLNQAGALVHIYNDGSVRLAHGGVEMGQGLHTKMIQVCAQALDIPMEYIHLVETNTALVPNSSPTAASASSDLNGMAVIDACTKLKARLEPINALLHAKASWKELIRKAYMERVSLSATGFYATPDLTFDWNSTKHGNLYRYFTCGVACTEVEIDALTGDHVVFRSDLIMDIGRSLNPGIDLGQIEGAFAQGQGWCTIEEPWTSTKSGMMLTRGPGTYKIPGFKDIPADFRVSLYKHGKNPAAIHSSKAVGEPPLFLGASVYYAIRDAIAQFRPSDDYFELSCPATSEKIRLACLDDIVKDCMTFASNDSHELPWFTVV